MGQSMNKKLIWLFFILSPPPPGFPVEPCGELVLGITGSIQTISQSIHLSKIYPNQVLQTGVIFVIILLDRC